MKETTRDFTHLWNDLPYSERSRLMPYAILTQKRHLLQDKAKAIRSHKALLKDFNDHIKNLDQELYKYRAALEDKPQ